MLADRRLYQYHDRRERPGIEWLRHVFKMVSYFASSIVKSRICSSVFGSIVLTARASRLWKYRIEHAHVLC